ncbi:glycine receptor subunit alphaZ1-like [Mytilus trossulus]|uniref:glycine receptor subunit alphaZ1-like n=1 Tax=Mytilus trossulus TaxID=6551 RepID=UPI00300521BB
MTSYQPYYGEKVRNVGAKIVLSHSTSSVVFMWSKRNIRKTLALRQFQISDIRHSDCRQTRVTNFSCLQMDFHLKRLLWSHILQVYAPTTILLIISWISFWLDCNAVTARTQLGILTFFTMVTQPSAAGIILPKVSYIIAIDAWHFMCLIFVFASVIEFAVVNVLARRCIPQYDNETMGRSLHTGDEQVRLYLCRILSLTRRVFDIYIVTCSGRSKAEKLDKLSRIGFPLMFLICTLVYWILVFML